jgi:hypothetical protein
VKSTSAASASRTCLAVRRTSSADHLPRAWALRY